MFLGGIIVMQGAVGAVRPELTAGFAIDQAEGQARLRALAADRAGQLVARRSRLARDRNAGARQRGGEILAKYAGDFEMFRGRLDRAKGDVGRSRAGTKNDGIEPRAAVNTACRFSVCDGVSP